MQSHTYDLFLASSSIYRTALLDRLNLNYIQLDPEFDEATKPGEAPGTAATRLAAGKADSVASHCSPAVIIASDQVASSAGQIVGKPGTVEGARRQLAGFSGQTVEFHTAVCVLNTATADKLTHLDTTVVCFRSLHAEEIDRYIAREPALDCAGSFKAEALGISLFESIDSSDPTALLGLPLIATARMLRRVGIAIP